MSTNKHAAIRYQALDKCFRNPRKRYFMEDLIEACNDAINAFDPNASGVQRRQIFEDIKFMESDQGWSIDLARYKDGRPVYYRYQDTNFSINNNLLNETEEGQLKEVLLTLSRFKGMPQFEWVDEMVIRLESSFSLKGEKGKTGKIIEFEQNQFLRGLEHFAELFNAILFQQPLLITYQSFRQTTPTNITISPYYLKQYNNRWFLFGRSTEREDLTNIAIDRIQKLSPAKSKFAQNETVDFNEFFEDVIGVSIWENGQPEKIIIKVKTQLWPYIETKPLHGSQKLIEKNDQYTIIQLTVLINYELTSLLFSFGEGITVLQPFELAEAIKEKANALLQNYS